LSRDFLIWSSFVLHLFKSRTRNAQAFNYLKLNGFIKKEGFASKFLADLLKITQAFAARSGHFLSAGTDRRRKRRAGRGLRVLRIALCLRRARPILAGDLLLPVIHEEIGKAQITACPS
jgi:hypothetical protein